MRALTNVSQLVSGLSNGTSISNTYNYMNDRLTSIKHNGFSYNFTYNTWGNLTAVKVNSQNLVSYTYGSAENRDRLGKITYGNGNTVNYLYDNEDNITGIKFNNDAALAYEYAYTDGILTSVTDNQSGYVTTYTDGGITVTKNGAELFETGYDSEDNYTEASNGTVYTLKYGDGGYDQATGISANESGIEFGGKRIAFNSSSDWFGRDISSSITATNSTGNTGSVGYSLTYKETASTATEYIDTYTSTVTPVSGTKTDTIYRYTYDNNGNIRTITKNGILQYTYNYDEAGQLTRADDAVQNKSFTYTYDIGGNIVSKKEYAYTTGTLGTVIDTKNYTYDSVWKDKLASYDGNVINYDQMGNPTNYVSKDLSENDVAGVLEYDGRQLVKSTNGSEGYEYIYNENGLMTKKLIYNNYDIDSNGKLVFSDLQSTYTYYWNDSKLMGYTLVNSSDGSLFNVKVMYGANDEPLGYTVTGDNDFEMGFIYTKNLQGDITGIYTLEGNSCILFSYDAYGTPTYTVGNSFIGAWLSLSLNPFYYRGYMYDINTGLYYLQSRHYNPIYGRFLNADETNVLHLTQGDILSTNLYAYCYNNPVNMVDYSGMLPDWVIPVVLGFVRSLKGPTAWARYYSAKGLLSAGGNSFLGYKGYSVARMLYNHGMWGYGRALSQSNKNLIINTLKKSSYFNNQIKKTLNAVKGTLVNKLKVSMSFTTGDLFYGIGRIDFYLTGSKKNNKWSVTVTGSDRYDFDSIWSFSKLSFGNAANDLGWAMQKIGMMIPFTWSVSFMYTY